MRLILGSGSPRRLDLLAQIGVVPDAVRPPDIDETPLKGELPSPYCQRMARQKAQAVVANNAELVLCADTTVALGRRILGKAETAAAASLMLRMLSGRRHRVITAVAIRLADRIWQKDVVTSVRFKALTRDEISNYLATNDWHGKAGAYGIQGPAGVFIPWISGSYAAVMGLPLTETANLLRTAGYDVPAGSKP